MKAFRNVKYTETVFLTFACALNKFSGLIPAVGHSSAINL
jgi:hypothetical protein